MGALRLLPRRKPKVFICYRRDDSSGYARSIYADLVRSFGKRQVFFDIDAIEGGDDFPEVTERFINYCDVFIAVIGKQWLTIDVGGTRRLDKPDDFVRREITSALTRRIPIIQVLVQGARALGPQDLPPELGALARLQAVEVSDTRWEYDIKQLINRINEVLSAQPIAWLKVGVIVSCQTLLVLGFVTWYLIYNGRNSVLPAKSPELKATPLLEPSVVKSDPERASTTASPLRTSPPAPPARERDSLPVHLCESVVEISYEESTT